MIFYIEFGNKFNFLVLKVFLGFFFIFYFPKGIWRNWHFLPFDFFSLSSTTVMVSMLVLVGKLGM